MRINHGAGVLVGLAPGRGPGQAERLHYVALLGARAISRAFPMACHACAISHFEQALSALGHLSNAPGSLEKAIAIRLQLRDALFPLGEQDRIAVVLREAHVLAETLSDSRRLARVLSSLTHYYWSVGDYRNALESGHRALEIDSTEPDVSQRVLAHFFLGMAYHALGDYRRATDLITRGAVVAEGARERLAKGTSERLATLWVFLLPWLTWSLCELGDFVQALATATQAVVEPLRIAESQSVAGCNSISDHRCGTSSEN